MSVQEQTRRRTTRDLRLWKGDPIVSLTAYTTPMARWLDPLCDFLLVGDSLGMVLHGLDSTLSVTVEMMILHGAAVMRGSRTACVIVDLPFGSYQESPEQAFRTAGREQSRSGRTESDLGTAVYLPGRLRDNLSNNRGLVALSGIVTCTDTTLIAVQSWQRQIGSESIAPTSPFEASLSCLSSASIAGSTIPLASG